MFMRVIILTLSFGSINQATFADGPTAGMSMKAFVEQHGEPDRREILNGADVFWYDSSEPYYAIFKNKKLVSYFIDKDTIARRDEELRRGQAAFENAQYEARAREQEYSDRRRQYLLKVIGNSFKPQPMPYQIPVNRPVNTNCTRMGNQVNCTSH